MLTLYSLERQQNDREIGRLFEEMELLKRRAEEKVNLLPATERNKYRQLALENDELLSRIAQRRGEIEAISQQVVHHERALKKDRFREQYSSLLKRHKRLQVERENLQVEYEATKLSPEEARSRLLAKVQDDNKRIKSLTADIETAEGDIQARRKQLQELEADLEELRQAKVPTTNLKSTSSCSRGTRI